MDNELMTITPDQALRIRTRDILLNALAVSSGAIDAVSFLDLGKVFSAFMTGNIAFLGLRAARAPGPDGLNVVVAVFAFGVGVYLATLIVRPSESFGIWSQRVTVALCVSLIAHAAFLSVWFASNGQPSGGVVPVLLASWGFAMGMQSAAVRRLHVDGVFTTAATATIILLSGDLANGPASAKERRRLAGILASLFAGATAGGLLSVHAHIYAPVLPFMITVVVVATAAFALGNLDAEGAEEAQPPAPQTSTGRATPTGFPSLPRSN
jgi:uncharacterized membrane protein YoaK (UPF0700 family)